MGRVYTCVGVMMCLYVSTQHVNLPPHCHPRDVEDGPAATLPDAVARNALNACEGPGTAVLRWCPWCCQSRKRACSQAALSRLTNLAIGDFTGGSGAQSSHSHSAHDLLPMCEMCAGESIGESFRAMHNSRTTVAPRCSPWPPSKSASACLRSSIRDSHPGGPVATFRVHTLINAQAVAVNRGERPDKS
jgi:hypothetical protein